MYAVFEDGSRQYRVSVGTEVVIDYRPVGVGDELKFDRVLLFADGVATKIGQPTLAGATVVGEVVDLPTEKTRIQHFRRRKNSKRLKGHRQPFVRVKVRSITA